MLLCNLCKIEKHESEFAPSHIGKLSGKCRRCNTALQKSWRRRNPETVNSYHRAYKKRRPEIYRNAILKTKYGIGIAEYEKMFSDQGGVCGICGNPETSTDSRTKAVRNLAVDHCHDEGHVRGLLCGKCNSGIGLFMHDEGLLMKAVTYLRKTTKWP